MDTKFFGVPFANAGDVAPVPDAAPVDGSVSYETGYGPDYELDPGSAQFVATIDNGAGLAGNILTVESVQGGPPLGVGSEIAGPGVTAGKTIVGLLTGAGGIGTYTVDGGALLIASEAMVSITNTDAKLIERDKMNQILNDITASVGRLQGQGFPQFITSADNDGTPFSYGYGVVVILPGDGKLYQSVVAANTATPGTDPHKWVTPPFRERLGANRTYFVDPAGNDSHDGLTLGTAWLTSQHAADYISNFLDLAGFNVSVTHSDGTYTDTCIVSGPFVGSDGVGSVSFISTLDNPAACIVSVANPLGGCFAWSTGAAYSVRGFKLTNTGGNLLYTNPGGICAFANIDFGDTVNSQIYIDNGHVSATDDYSISGDASNHVQLKGGGDCSRKDITVTLTGTPAYSGAFVNSDNNSSYREEGTITYTGGATGKKFNATMNGTIDTGTGDINHLPGSVAGTQSTGGQYG